MGEGGGREGGMGGKFGLTLVQVALLKIGCARGKIFLFGIFYG